MARSTSSAERAVLQRKDFIIYARLLVDGAPIEESLSLSASPLVKASVVSDVDLVAQTGVFGLNLLTGAQSLSPWYTGGASIGGEPMLQENRLVEWQVACVDPGTARPAGDSATWRALFRGRIDDVAVSPSGRTVTITCRDIIRELLRAEIENISTVDGQPAWGFPVDAGLLQDQMVAILNTAWNYVYGIDYPDTFLVHGTAPTDSGSAFWQERTNLMDAIRAVGVGKNGWDLRAKWDLSGQDSHLLTYYHPYRDPWGIGSPSFETTHWLALTPPSASSAYRYLRIRDLKRSIVGVRNVAEVTPADTARVPVVTVNTDSETRFGRAFSAIAEDYASHIDTAGEATTLGQLYTTDRGWPKTAITVECPFNWIMEVNDGLLVGSDGYCYDGAESEAGIPSRLFAITRTELTYDHGSGGLIVSGREAGGAAQIAAWHQADERTRRRSVYVSTGEPVGPARERALWLQVEPPA